MVEERLKDHERRIARLEACWESAHDIISEMRDDIKEIKKDVKLNTNNDSATKAQVGMILSLITPIITGIVVYFLTRGN